MYKARFVFLFTMVSLASTLGAQTTVLLNTGYNNGAFTLYPAASVNDHYWLNIASFPPTNPPVGPTWVLPNPIWASGTLPNSRWIGVRNTDVSPAGTSFARPAYMIFRKCFCLLAEPEIARPTLAFDVRADDWIQMWLNRLEFELVGPQIGNYFASLPISARTNDVRAFRKGVNCIYALVEDIGGHTGFDLAGSVTAIGLDPVTSTGAEQTFRCPCEEGNRTPSEEDLAEIVQYAEERRLARQQLPRLR